MTQIISQNNWWWSGGWASYTAWTWIDITSNEISIDEDVVQTVGNMVDNLTWADDDHYPTAKAVADAISWGWLWDVIWPASSTDWDIVLFDWVSGKIIKDSWALLSSKLDASALSDNNYWGGWSGDTTHTPTKNALYTKIHTMDVEIGNKAADNTVVKITWNQTIDGTKTFTTSPVVPSKTTDATNTGTAIATEAQVYKKQDALTAQTAYTAQWTASKVPQITTNALWQVTGIAEVSINYPSQVDDTAYGNSWDWVTTTAPSKNAVYDKISSIDDLIPSAATSSNKLTDKNYVDDSINSVTAYYITKTAAGDQWSTYAELAAATTFYSGWVVRTPTRNDYTIVLADENHDNATTRYIYNSGWEYQYTVNETALTQAQLDALNSGITSWKVSTYDWYATWKQDALTTQTAYTTKGTSTKVATISTNTLGQVTAITETSIDFPVTSVNGSVGAITWLATTSDLSWKQDKATSGSTAPSSTPTYIWQQYVDTTNDKMYVATGTSSSSDWMEVWAWWWEVWVSTQANNILTIWMKIWAGTQANYEALWTYDNNTVYLTI